MNNHEVILGDVAADTMHLSQSGSIVKEQWLAIPSHYPSATLDDFVIMPNHIHGIVILNEPPVGAIHESPLRTNEHRPIIETYAGHRRQMTLPKIIGRFKMNSAKRINLLQGTSGSPVWQRGYYDHVIRDDADLLRIRTYITNNAMQWALDEENPDQIPCTT